MNPRNLVTNMFRNISKLFKTKAINLTNAITNTFLDITKIFETKRNKLITVNHKML